VDLSIAHGDPEYRGLEASLSTLDDDLGVAGLALDNSADLRKER
jgi:hypothetical protein